MCEPLKGKTYKGHMLLNENKFCYEDVKSAVEGFLKEIIQHNHNGVVWTDDVINLANKWFEDVID